MTTQISRDPFARTTLVRRIYTDDLVGAKCDWCGNPRKGHKGYLAHLFQYGTENDGINQSYIGPHWHKGLFCSKSCHDSYQS